MTSLICRYVLLAAFCLIPAQASALVIGTFDDSRAGPANIIDGPVATQFRDALSANFPGITYAGTGALTGAFLSSVDILVIHDSFDSLTEISPLSATEQQALLDFVVDGKSALILADGFYPTAPQSFGNPFSAQVAGYVDSGSDIGPITNLTHLVANGPFGQANSFATAYPGWFTDVGPYATTLAVLGDNGLASYAAIERNAIAPGSGRVILSADATAFADDGLVARTSIRPMASADATAFADDGLGGGGHFSDNETLLLNSIEWLLPAPEPSSIVLAAIAFALLFGKVGSSMRVQPRR